NFAGVSEWATERYDDEADLAEIPVLTDTAEFPFYYVNLSFTSAADDKYASDYRGRIEKERIWECVVETRDEVEEVVEINWDVSEVPGEYYVYLKDKVTDKTTDMRQTPIYRYQGDKRQFSLVVTTHPIPVIGTATTLENAYCYPNPTKDKITFVLPPGKVTIQIFSIAGEKVFEEVDTDGVTWTWKCINSANEKVASGIYIYTLSDGNSIKKGKLGVIK
ncbi:MAG: T9SS type A sorting domain-containing protein, partial [bacterium]|nr:T9SS type A sorting domain-containing protein [bacterium]